MTEVFGCRQQSLARRRNAHVICLSAKTFDFQRKCDRLPHRYAEEDTMADDVESRAVELDIRGKKRVFDVDDPVLPDWVEEEALKSGDFPYNKKLKEEDYRRAGKAAGRAGQGAILAAGDRQAGDGAVRGPRCGRQGRRDLGLLGPHEPAPCARRRADQADRPEAGQWYFQRYVAQFPTAGEFVLFDRSWYNRAGVEPVMGFCTPKQYEDFLKQTPQLRKVIAHEGIFFFKFYLDIGREMQLKRFHDRRHDPLKVWKLSSMDIAALTKWGDYSESATGC
jgi:polyphosphate kinase 2 (PPK2 family)